MKSKTNKSFFLILVLLLAEFHIEAEEILQISGEYLFYSYDHNYIFGQGNLKININNHVITGQRINIDISQKKGEITGDCHLINQQRKLKVDVVKIDLDTISLNYLSFRQSVISGQIDLKKKSDREFKKKYFPVRTLGFLKKSLLYFICKKIIIKKNFDVIGYHVSLFLEGWQSLTFKKFRMNKGFTDSDNLFYLNKLWYYNSIGLVADIFVNFYKQIKKKVFKTKNNLKLHYDIFNRNPSDYQWKFLFDSQSNFQINQKNLVNFHLNLITENMTDISLSYSSKITKFIDTLISVTYKKPLKKEEELWWQTNTDINLNKLGRINLDLNFERSSQFSGEISYNISSIKNLSLSVKHSASHLLNPDFSKSKRQQSSISLIYDTKIFNLSAHYSLNHDLLNNYRQINPQLFLRFSPFTLYRGLLHFNVLSSLTINNIRESDSTEYVYRANIGIDISSEKLQLTKGFDLDYSFRVEQLIDKDYLNNISTAGIILRARQDLFNLAELELLYNYQTRRKTENWFIPGTTAQNISATLKSKDKGITKIWASLSYNSKTAQMTSGYFNFRIDLIKNWMFQTLMNYDFLFKNFNYDFYLIRKAGRISVRLTYRSLSRQILFELLPYSSST